MEQKTNLYPGEEKIADGIYLTKFDKKEKEIIINRTTTNDTTSGETTKPQYVFKSTADLINILENEFEQLSGQIKRIYNANEEMLKYDPNDYDLIEARQENLELINTKNLRLMEIQSELKTYCPTNPLVLRNIYDNFLILKENEKSKKVSKEDYEYMGNEDNISIGVTNTIKEEDKKDDEVITEIDL